MYLLLAGLCAVLYCIMFKLVDVLHEKAYLKRQKAGEEIRPYDYVAKDMNDYNRTIELRKPNVFEKWATFCHTMSLLLIAAIFILIGCFFGVGTYVFVFLLGMVATIVLLPLTTPL